MHILALFTLGFLCVGAPTRSLAQAVGSVRTGAASSPAHAAYYIDTSVLSIAPLLEAPPSQNSDQAVQEFAELHTLQNQRTLPQVAAAIADDQEEDIFSYRTVLGEAFTAKRLPLTAALSAHVHGEESAVSIALKQTFSRPRPYQADKTLRPVCKLTKAANSYPSGHTISGYLLGLTLTQMVPEKKQQILERADDYAHNRLVCGVHYASDLEASRRTAYVVFGYMLANPKFLKDVQSARAELRAVLGLIDLPANRTSASGN